MEGKLKLTEAQSVAEVLTAMEEACEDARREAFTAPTVTLTLRREKHRRVLRDPSAGALGG